MKSKVSVHTRLNRALNEVQRYLLPSLSPNIHIMKRKKANQLLERLYFRNSIEIVYLVLKKNS